MATKRPGYPARMAKRLEAKRLIRAISCKLPVARPHIRAAVGKLLRRPVYRKERVQCLLFRYIRVRRQVDLKHPKRGRYIVFIIASGFRLKFAFTFSRSHKLVAVYLVFNGIGT